MECKKCGHTCSDDMKFCGNCGHNLEGKVKCLGCERLVDEEFNFCPYCSTNLKGDQDITGQNVRKVPSKTYNKKSFIPALTNSIVILLSIVMVAVLFGRVAKYELPYEAYRQEVTLSTNIVDYVKSPITRVSEYTIDDFVDEYRLDGNRYDANIKEINMLDYFMIDEFDQNYSLQRLFIFINLLLLITMIILPLILLGLSIYDLSNLRQTKKYKKFLFTIMILGLALVITLPLTGLKVGIMTVVYILLSCIGLIYSYIIELFNKERTFNGPAFSLRIITSLILFILIFVSGSSILTYDAPNEYSLLRSETRVNYGDFSLVSNFLSDHEIRAERLSPSPLISILASEDIEDGYSWLRYIAVSIPIFMVTATAFLVTSFSLETASNTGVRRKYGLSVLFTWIAFVLEIVTLIATLLFRGGLNSYVEDYHSSNPITEISLGFGFITLIVLTLAIAIYNTIVSSTLRNK